MTLTDEQIRKLAGDYALWRSDSDLLAFARALLSASIADTAKPYERHDPDNATAPFLSFIPDAKRDELIGALLASLDRNADRETDFYTVRSFIGGLGLLAAQFAPTPVESIADTAGAKLEPLVTLSGAQLLEAFNYVAPDHPNDPDQLECDVTIAYGEGHSGKGHYCWITDYPDEGAILLDGKQAEGIAAPPAPSVADAASVDIRALVNRFLAWPLPKTLAADQCATDPNYPHQRSGTNLMTADEAEAMMRYVLGAAFETAAQVCEQTVCEASRNHLFRSGAKICAGEIRKLKSVADAAGASEHPAFKLLAALIDILDDERNNAPEHRCYVEGAWNDVMDEARAYVAKESGND